MLKPGAFVGVQYFFWAINISVGDVDNNEGTTVVDATNSKDLSYSFAVLCGDLKQITKVVYLYPYEMPHNYDLDSEAENKTSILWYEDDEYPFDGKDDECGIEGLSQYPLVQQLDTFHCLSLQKMVNWANQSVLEPMDLKNGNCDEVNSVSLRVCIHNFFAIK